MALFGPPSCAVQRTEAIEAVPECCTCGTKMTGRYDYVWIWRRRFANRVGQPCVVLAECNGRGTIVEFADGERIIANSFAVKRLIDRENGSGKTKARPDSR